MTAGESEITQPRNLIYQTLTIVFQRVLSIPRNETDVEAQCCHEKNLLYFPRAMVERNLVIAALK